VLLRTKERSSVADMPVSAGALDRYDRCRLSSRNNS
jgi:hypothetical protein